MANEAFALSPISARAASLNDADFEAIREAFLETARGRWFLEEYTKRNRNADTAMVLEAVARIEHTLAAQKEEQKPQPSNELPNAMAAVKAIVTAARDNALAALDGSALGEALAPSRKCARVIHEIAWGLRESGADGRICSLLDMQVDAINAACDQVAAGGLRDSVLQAFDQAAQQIDDLTPPTATSEAAAFAVVVPPQDDEPASDAPAVVLTLVTAASESAAQDAARDKVLIETAATAEALDVIAETETMAGTVSHADGASLAEPIEAFAEVEACVEPAEPQLVRTVHLTIVTDVVDDEPKAEIVAEPAAEMPALIAPESLGASLIASGIIARPTTSRIDLLAPIRRMSQAEKVAFFS